MTSGKGLELVRVGAEGDDAHFARALDANAMVLAECSPEHFSPPKTVLAAVEGRRSLSKQLELNWTLVRLLLQTMLGDGRASEVTTLALELRSVMAIDGSAGIHIEAAETRCWLRTRTPNCGLANTVLF